MPSASSLASTFAAWEPALLVLVFAGLGLLLAGYYWKTPRRHFLRIGGWALFAAYWPFHAPQFFVDGDPVNGWFTLFGPLFLLFIAYHEWRSYQWGEDPAALRWMTGASAVAALTYFIIYKIEPVTNALIYWTALQSAWMLGWLFNVPTTVSPDGNLFINGSEYAVTIILACTAIQSIMIFVGAIACTRAASVRKWKAYAWTVPVIYFLNLFRNAGIVYGYKILVWNPFGWGPTPSGSMFWQYYYSYEYGSFEWMHSYVGKIGSLLALIVIALAVFRTLPELHSNILDVLDLWKRRRAGFYAPEGGPARPREPVAASGAKATGTNPSPPPSEGK